MAGLPAASLMNFLFWSFGGGLLDAAALSRELIRLFWSFNSNWTWKNPVQQNTIDNTEITEAKEGALCIWTVILGVLVILAIDPYE